LIPEIRTKIEARLGKPILYSKDCEVLAKSIEKVCGERIGITTIKRLFGFASGTTQPRLYTLNLLAQYIGYKNWETLVSEIEDSKNLSVVLDYKIRFDDAGEDNINLLNHQVSISLATQSVDINEVVKLCNRFGRQKQIFPFLIDIIAIAVRQKNIQFLRKIYKLPNVFDEQVHDHFDFYYVGQTLGLMLRLNPDIIDELIETLAADEKAQRYFIEWFVDEDHLTGYYGRMLDVYHKYKNLAPQDNLFYYCLKHSQAIQLDDTSKANFFYKQIKHIPVDTSFHPILAGRYVGISISEENTSPFSKESPLYNLISYFIYHEDYQTAITFLLFLCRELLGRDRDDWLIDIVSTLIAHFKEFHNRCKNHWGIKIENQNLIYIAYVYHLKGDFNKAWTYFNKIDTNLFDPFFYKQIKSDYDKVRLILKPQ